VKPISRSVNPPKNGVNCPFNSTFVRPLFGPSAATATNNISEKHADLPAEARDFSYSVDHFLLCKTCKVDDISMMQFYMGVTNCPKGWPCPLSQQEIVGCV
jgi:hypothetical protein